MLSDNFKVATGISIVSAAATNSFNLIPYYIALGTFNSTWMIHIFNIIIKKFNIDVANDDLIKLIRKLDDLKVDTNLELIKDSTVDSTEYRIKFYKNLIPVITQEKYILVPCYNSFLDDTEEKCILQEHVIGSKDYTLSIGSPSLKFKPVKVLN